MLFAFLSPASPAYAQEPTPENDENCVSCHEHQYYVYDSGKWYCLCEAPMHCVYCHGGRTGSQEKDAAHEGLVLYPTRNQAERCQACHAEDYLSRVVTFDTVAGISDSPLPLITATPAELAAGQVEQKPTPPLLRLGQLEPWRLVVLGGLTIAMMAVIILGYRCYKADCLLKSKP
jgi:hypothetical protein